MIDKINEIIEPCIAKDIKDKYSLVKIAKGYSATLYANSLINIDTSLKTVYRIMFKNNDDLIKLFPHKYEVNVKIDGDGIPNYQINVPKNEETLFDTLNELREVICAQQEYIFEDHPSDMPFGCCSHYEECSKEGYCIMYSKDRAFYKGCSYKANLEKGRIFYGENKNV